MADWASKRTASGASTATILVIEDDPVMSRTLSKALEANGYQVRTAATGAEARSLFGEVKPDLILMDLMLPDDDGLVLTASFRTLSSAPIVICSARQGQIDRVLGLRLGAADFVAKPFELDDLGARVEAVLRANRPELPPPTDELQARRRRHRATARLQLGAKHGMDRE